MKSTLRFALVLSLLALLLAGCAADAGDPADAVEAYLIAMSVGDADSMVVVSCADWEQSARDSSDGFLGVQTTLSNLSCQTLSEEGDSAKVTCDGTLTVSYEGESREIQLSTITYDMVKQGGTWLVCGQE